MEDIRIDGIDMAEVEKHHSGGTESYVELLRLYCVDGRRKLALLVKLLKERDYDRYGVEVHGLKSASASVGAMELSAQALEHEMAVKEGNTAYILSHARALLEKYSWQLERIEGFLENRDKTSGGKEKNTPLSGKEVLAGVRKALEQLEDFQSRGCVETVGGLLEHGLEKSVELQLQEIRTQLIMYEDDEAERLLRALAAQLEKEE